MVADMWALRRKPQRRVFLYTPTMLASSYRPFAHLLRGLFGPLGQERVTLVLRDHGVRGVLQAQRRPHRPEVDLLYLNAYLKHRQPMSEGDVWYRLVEETIRRAGEYRVERIFAAVGTRFDDVGEVVRQLGFQPYAQQRLWTLPEPTVEAGSTLRALRRQRSQDAWAIHQLYSSVTPRQVQQAEMRLAEGWQLARRQWQQRERGWVLGDDQTLTAHVQVCTGVRGHVLRFQIAPHVRDEAPNLLRYVLSQLDEPRPIFVLQPTYHSEFDDMWADLGFVLRAEQTLFVKHVALRRKQPLLIPGLRRADTLELASPHPSLPHLTKDDH